MEDNTAYGAKYWWHNWIHNKNQKTSKTWNTMRYSVSNKQKSSQSLQDNAITVFGPRLYNSLPKYLRDIENVKTEKFKFELDKFLDTIPDPPKMPNYVPASGSNSILDQLTHLRAQGIYQSVESLTRPWKVLAASKPLQVLSKNLIDQANFMYIVTSARCQRYRILALIGTTAWQRYLQLSISFLRSCTTLCISHLLPRPVIC